MSNPRPRFFELAALLCIAVCATAQEQHPEIFIEPSIVTIGVQRTETLWTEAKGKWSDADDKLGTDSTHIECYKKLGFCSEAEAYSLGGQAWVRLETLDILRWDSEELIAVDSSPICQVDQIRFDFKTKQVTVTGSLKGDTKVPFCKDLKPTTAFLGGLKDELKRIDKEAAQKKK
jgi:hypothetical protein